MNKIFILILSLSIYLINVTNSQQLTGDILQASKDIFYNINGYNTSNPCLSNPNVFFQCVKVYNTMSDYYVLTVQLSRNYSVPLVNFDADFTPFVNVSTFRINNLNINSLFSKLPHSSTAYYYMYITGLSTTIDPNVVLPKAFFSVTFYDINVPIPSAFFASSLYSFTIYSFGGSFSLPSQIPVNGITNLILPITHVSNLANDSHTSFPKLKKATFTIYNDQTKPGYQPFNLPNFNFEKIDDLTIKFESFVDNNPALLKSTDTQVSTNQYQLWEFDQTLNNPSIRDLYILGIGFSLPSSKYVDLSNLHLGAEIEIISADPLLNCTEKPCIKTPLNAKLRIQGMSTNILNIEFNNFRRIEYMDSTKSGQTLPTDIDFNELDHLIITRSDMVGAVPDSYCKLFRGQLELSSNELTEIPNCFRCVGGSYASTQYLFPNQFTDFNSSSPPSECKTFNINMDYNKVAKTDGSTVITLTGTDFGWTAESGPNVHFVAQTHDAFDAPMMNVTIPNYELELFIPQGVGSNLNYTFFFGVNNRFNVTFNYTYEVPVITGYTLAGFTTGTISLVINGTGFDYNNENPINVNGVEINASPADTTFINNGVYYTPDSEDLNPNTKLTVFAIIGGQKSNTIEFTIFGKLSLDAPTAKLNETGGSLTLTGNFSTATISITSVTINGVSCTVTSVTPTSITITYPASSIGVHPIIVSVGGQLLSSEVEIIASPTPIPTTTPTGSPAASSSDVDGSNSTALSISITMLILCLILSIIF